MDSQISSNLNNQANSKLQSIKAKQQKIQELRKYQNANMNTSLNNSNIHPSSGKPPKAKSINPKLNIGKQNSKGKPGIGYTQENPINLKYGISPQNVAQMRDQMSQNEMKHQMRQIQTKKFKAPPADLNQLPELSTNPSNDMYDN